MARSTMWRRIGRGETYVLMVESYDNGSNHGYSSDNCPIFDWRIIDGLGSNLDSSTDDNDRIKLGVGDKIDAKKALGSLVSFLGQAAEAFENGSEEVSFCEATAGWAADHADELSMLAVELESGIGL